MSHSASWRYEVARYSLAHGDLLLKSKLTGSMGQCTFTVVTLKPHSGGKVVNRKLLLWQIIWLIPCAIAKPVSLTAQENRFADRKTAMKVFADLLKTPLPRLKSPSQCETRRRKRA
jgi:hypothetical protein